MIDRTNAYFDCTFEGLQKIIVRSSVRIKGFFVIVNFRFDVIGCLPSVLNVNTVANVRKCQLLMLLQKILLDNLFNRLSTFSIDCQIFKRL